jgi:SAM-dependent methyltransferase
MVYPNKRALLEAHIALTDRVLDVGFFGQGVGPEDPNWPHATLIQRAREVYGLDLALPANYAHDPHYQQASAEDFNFDTTFNVIFAGDLIEHVSNPGLFLECAKKQLAPGGKLILTTPNTFNLFNLAEKLTKREPTVNPDHTFYFNYKTLGKLLEKNGMHVSEIHYVYSLDCTHAESIKKKLLNGIYWLLSFFTDKFMETLVIIATPQSYAHTS